MCAKDLDKWSSYVPEYALKLFYAAQLKRTQQQNA